MFCCFLNSHGMVNEYARFIEFILKYLNDFDGDLSFVVPFSEITQRIRNVTQLIGSIHRRNELARLHQFL